MNLAIPIFLVAALSAVDLEQLTQYDTIRMQQRPEVIEQARRTFAGRGRQVAEHFLRHGDYPPSGGAYAFVLKVLGDVEATVILIRALPDPPKLESGVMAKYGMGRDDGEIASAIEAVLENDHVRGDTRVITALVEAVAAARARPHGIGLGTAGRAVSLLGKCRGAEAIGALQALAKDPDPSIRSAAIQALGQIDLGPEEREKVRLSRMETLARTLFADPDTDARLGAATSLGQLGELAGVDPLRKALESERDPRVVDAIVMALRALRAPFDEGEPCRKTLERCWTPNACAPLFACWVASVTREDVIEAATIGPPVFRALAIYSLVQVPEPRTLQRFLFRQGEPPPLTGPPASGSKAVMRVPVPVKRPAPSVELDTATRNRLLASAVEVLSHPIVTIPLDPQAVAYETAQMTRDALWELSERNMPVALQYADRITPVYARSASSGRYAASHDLLMRDPAAYVAYRRPRQFFAAILLAIPVTFLLVPRRTRHGAILLVTAIIGWGIWSLFAKGIRGLPPPPLSFLTLSCIAFLAAGTVSGALSFLSRGASRFSWLRAGPGRAGLTVIGAAGLAFGICAWSRWSSLFPIGGEGWELLFDPFGAAILAAGVAMPLALLDIVLSRWWGGDTDSCDAGSR